MRFFWTDEDRPARRRGSALRAALAYAGHSVHRGVIGDEPPPGTDVWIYGLGVVGAPAIEPRVVGQLLDAQAAVVLTQLCDAESMCFERIPHELAIRARLFLRNHWPSDSHSIPAAFRDRIGWAPPMIKSMPARPGRLLRERSHGAIFFGTRTGFSNMPGNKNAREEVVRILRASGLPFLGGLLHHGAECYRTEPSLLVPRLRERTHLKHLANSKICLAPWGNHRLTYRLFEGMAMRCLVLAQPIRSTRFLDAGLEPGTHYVEIAPDLSDLADAVRYYLNHLDEAQCIADAGHEHFKKYFAARGPLISKWIFDSVVGSWGDLYRSAAPRRARSVAIAAAARLRPSAF
ncbi:MAG TPA: glycosyltransferase [Polyangiaceae bacterium]|nr:glycosyltransferase [Polyangiaceae bacterium]